LTAEIKGGALEQSTGEGLEGAGELSLAAGQLVVEANDADVLLSSALLGLDETSRAVNADDQASSDLGIEGAAVASLFSSKNALDPRDDFVTGGVGGLVEVNDTRADVGLDVSLQWRAAIGDRCEVTGADEQLVVVLEEQRPRARVKSRCDGLGLDGVLIVPLVAFDDVHGHLDLIM
jgi:hypothetical protein